MKKIYIVRSVLGAIILLVVGGLIGFIIGSYSAMQSHLETSQRQEDMQRRTEGYVPTCEQLKSIGNPKLIKKEDDYFVVDASENYFVVFGFNAEPGKVPVTAWWGADRKKLIQQKCKQEK